MKLVRFGGGRIGVLQDGKVYDATDAVGADPKAWPPTGMVQLIADYESLRPKLEQALKGEGRSVDSVALEAPLVWPHKLLAYPVNYLAHGHEMNSKNRANINGFFLKSNSSISGESSPRLSWFVAQPANVTIIDALVDGHGGDRRNVAGRRHLEGARGAYLSREHARAGRGPSRLGCAAVEHDQRDRHRQGGQDGRSDDDAHLQGHHRERRGRRAQNRTPRRPVSTPPSRSR